MISCRYDKSLISTYMFIPVEEERSHAGSGHKCFPNNPWRGWGLWYHIINCRNTILVQKLVLLKSFSNLILLDCCSMWWLSLIFVVFHYVQMTFNYMEKTPNSKFMQLYGFSSATVWTLNCPFVFVWMWLPFAPYFSYVPMWRAPLLGFAESLGHGDVFWQFEYTLRFLLVGIQHQWDVRRLLL